MDYKKQALVHYPVVEISTFIGKTFTDIQGAKNGSDSIVFKTSTEVYVMYHWQECCEEVELIDVCGDSADLLETPIVEAYVEQNETPDDKTYVVGHDHETWTFYRLRTIKGVVTLRWKGESNGYYSESVDIVKVPQHSS